MITAAADTSNLNSQQTPMPLPHQISSKTIPAIIGVVCLALIIGISFIGVSSRKGPMLDRQRFSDFSNLQTEIENYFTTRGYIPENLDTFSNKDPETKLPYDYKPLSDYSYQLCATFSTEKTAVHKKGYDCITYELNESDKPDPFIFTKPQNDEKLCLGQLYPIEWETNKNVSKIVSLSLFPQRIANLVNVNSWKILNQAQSLNAGKPINLNKSNSRQKGSFTWKVGDVLDNSTVKRVTDIFPSDYYHMCATIINNGALEDWQYGYCEFITLSDCSED